MVENTRWAPVQGLPDPRGANRRDEPRARPAIHRASVPFVLMASSFVTRRLCREERSRSHTVPPSYPLSPHPLLLFTGSLSFPFEGKKLAKELTPGADHPRVLILHARRILPAGTCHRGYIAGSPRCPICARDGTGAAKISDPLSSWRRLRDAGKGGRGRPGLCWNGLRYLRDCRGEKSAGVCRVESRWREVAAPISRLRPSGCDVSRSTMPREPGAFEGHS